MRKNDGVRFTSSSINLCSFSSQNHNPFFSFSRLPFCCHTLTSTLARTKFSVAQFFNSFISSKGANRLRPITPLPLLCSSTLALSRSDESNQSGAVVDVKDSQQKSVSRHRREDEERVLISEVLIMNKDGEELEMKEMELEALAALKASRPNSALTVREVQEDVHRVIKSGYFCSCVPVAYDTRDGIRLVFQNQTRSFMDLYVKEPMLFHPNF